jgi:hypothetical protein
MAAGAKDYSDTLEAYLRDELATEQRERFEQQLTRDPLLRQECELLKEVIEAFCAYRRKELKQRLNNQPLFRSNRRKPDSTNG